MGMAWRVLMVAWVGAVVGCGPADGGRPDLTGRKARIVVTTGMIADIARNTAGDTADVDALMGPGVDPHLYQPSPRDVQRLRAADLVLYNGLHLEGKMADVLAKLPRSVAVTRGLAESDLRPAPDGTAGAHDPHVWFDVSLWEKCAVEVEKAMADLDPPHAADFARNGSVYRERLRALHAEVKKRADGLPADRRVLVTAHDAFYYFGHAYGFRVHGLQGVSTVAEVDVAGINRLATLIGGQRVPAIFAETSVSDKGLAAVQAEVKTKYGFDVRITGDDERLYSDALGEPGTPAATYEGMVRHNVEVILGALK